MDWGDVDELPLVRQAVRSLLYCQLDVSDVSCASCRESGQDGICELCSEAPSGRSEETGEVWNWRPPPAREDQVSVSLQHLLLLRACCQLPPEAQEGILSVWELLLQGHL